MPAKKGTSVTRRFFFYGTLSQLHNNALTRTMAPKIARAAAASVPGRLFAILTPNGAYPALVEGGPEGLVVRGRYYEMNERFTDEDLGVIDAYEEYRPDTPARSIYRREERQVRLFDGETVTAETYLYNQRIPHGAPLIPMGDFPAWLRRTGKQPFQETP